MWLLFIFAAIYGVCYGKPQLSVTLSSAHPSWPNRFHLVPSGRLLCQGNTTLFPNHTVSVTFLDDKSYNNPRSCSYLMKQLKLLTTFSSRLLVIDSAAANACDDAELHSMLVELYEVHIFFDCLTVQKASDTGRVPRLSASLEFTLIFFAICILLTTPLLVVDALIVKWLLKNFVQQMFHGGEECKGVISKSQTPKKGSEDPAKVPKGVAETTGTTSNVPAEIHDVSSLPTLAPLSPLPASQLSAAAKCPAPGSQLSSVAKSPPPFSHSSLVAPSPLQLSKSLVEPSTRAETGKSIAYTAHTIRP